MFSIDHLQKSFGASPLLTDICFTLPEGSTLAILGQSGCGKTTLLQIIAGLIKPDSGQITHNGIAVAATPLPTRGIVYLNQSALLFPHLNVFENIAFGLRLRKISTSNLHAQTNTMLDSLALTALANRLPHTLSGGEAQRVAFGRALIIQPKLLLLDEPFAALDHTTRAAMQTLFRETAAQHHITAIFVTHDLKEALLLGNRWGYLAGGSLTIFDSKAAFANDPRTGIDAEIAFWQQANK